MAFMYKHLALGGTFDLLHAGHKALLRFAFDRAEKVSIGITSDTFVRSNEKSFVKNLLERREELDNFMNSEKLITRSQIVLLDDLYGTTLTDNTIEGLVITQETKKGGDLINKARSKAGVTPLPLLRFSMLAADDGGPISSTRIRQGEINREGFSYFGFLSSADRFILPYDLRVELAEVHGKLMSSIDQIKSSAGETLISVGDETTINFIKNGVKPDLAIVDFRINRKDVFREISDLGYPKDKKFIRVKNEHGTIDASLIKVINSFFSSSSHSAVIKVDGEEDLAVLPVVLLAPLGTKVFYGQPNQGLVLVEVTETEKAEFLKTLKKFQTK